MHSVCTYDTSCVSFIINCVCLHPLVNNGTALKTWCTNFASNALHTVWSITLWFNGQTRLNTLSVYSTLICIFNVYLLEQKSIGTKNAECMEGLQTTIMTVTRFLLNIMWNLFQVFCWNKTKNVSILWTWPCFVQAVENRELVKGGRLFPAYLHTVGLCNGGFQMCPNLYEFMCLFVCFFPVTPYFLSLQLLCLLVATQCALPWSVKCVFRHLMEKNLHRSVSTGALALAGSNKAVKGEYRWKFRCDVCVSGAERRKNHFGLMSAL